MTTEGQHGTAVKVIRRFDRRVAVFIQNRAFRQINPFALRHLNFALRNHARRVINDERRVITRRDANGDGIRSKTALQTAKRHDSARLSTSTADRNNPDTSLTSCSLYIFPQSTDMTRTS